MGEVLAIKEDVLRESRDDEEAIVPNTTPRLASA